MKLWNWIKNLLKKEDKAPVVIVSPEPSLPEVPTQEEVDNFPSKKEIADFKFVDSSHHHPDFDVTKYPANLLINKATQGSAMIDRTFAKRAEICKKSGIFYTGYHFFECKVHWKTQLEHYLKVMSGANCDGNPILDFETWDKNQDMNDLKGNIENAYQWMVEAEKATGKTCILYAGYHVLKALNLPEKFKRFPVWIPRYSSSLGEIPAPYDKKSIMAWQFTESGQFHGFKGGNDVNIYYGKNNHLNLE